LRVFIKVKIKIILNYFEVVNVRLVNGASSNGGIYNSSSRRSSNSSSGSVRVVGESESISPVFTGASTIIIPILNCQI
jgi:hypothetical protein